jgi:hypothetical protein
MPMARAVQLKDKNGNKVFAAPWMPIGSIFLTVSNDNPSKYFGGTWEKISGGFLWGCNSAIDNNLMNSSVGSTKSFDTTLTINQIPSHKHIYWAPRMYYSEQAGGEDILGVQDGSTTYRFERDTSYTGGGKGHSHDIPHIGVWVWKRIK